MNFLSPAVSVVGDVVATVVSTVLLIPVDDEDTATSVSVILRVSDRD